MKRILVFIFFLVSSCVNAQISKVIPSKPNPPRLVNDLANMLTAEQQHALENKLLNYSDSTSSQITIVTVESLEGYEDEEFAIALGRAWGVGGSEFNNGIVILIAKQDRKSRIEVGYGLEGAIPDITAKTIIEDDIVPNFKQGNYYRGLDKATDDLIKAAAGEYKSSGSNRAPGGKGIGIGAIFFIIFVIIMIANRRGGGRGGGGMISRRGYGDIGTAWLLGTLLGGGGGRDSGGGWSGGGGGGGGFGGFGGGSFGGGGASGSW